MSIKVEVSSDGTIKGTAGNAAPRSWNEITGKPSTFPPSSHGHPISEVEELEDALDEKAPIESPAFTGTVSGVTKAMVGLGSVDNTSDANKPVSTAQAAADTAVANAAAADAATKANAAQAHAIQRENHTGEQAIATVTGLQAALEGKSATGHGHVIGDTTGLQAALDAKLAANDASVTNAREWTAATVTQVDAEAGTATTRVAWTVQRVWQAIAAWWSTVASTKADTVHSHGQLGSDGTFSVAGGIVSTDDDGTANAAAPGAGLAVDGSGEVSVAVGGIVGSMIAADAIEEGNLVSINTPSANGDVLTSVGGTGFGWETPTATPTANAIVRYDAGGDLLTANGIGFSDGGSLTSGATASRTWTLPDADGTVVLADGNSDASTGAKLYFVTTSGTLDTTGSTGRTWTLPDESGAIAVRDGAGDIYTQSLLTFSGASGSWISTTGVTSSRIWTLPDASGTLVLAGDLATVATSGSAADLSGTLPPASLSLTKAELNTAVSDGNVIFVGDAPTAHASSHAIGGSDPVVVSQLGSSMTLSGTASKGISLDTTSRTVSQANTLAIMGGTVGIGTLTPGRPLEIAYDQAGNSSNGGLRLTNPTATSASTFEFGVGGTAGYDRYGIVSINGITALRVTPSGVPQFALDLNIASNKQIIGEANANAYILLNNGSGVFRQSCVTSMQFQVSYVTAMTMTSTALNLASGVALQVNSTQVVTSRKTGWTAATGTATRTAFATSTATTEEVAQRLKALIDDLISHGLIGT